VNFLESSHFSLVYPGFLAIFLLLPSFAAPPLLLASLLLIIAFSESPPLLHVAFQPIPALLPPSPLTLFRFGLLPCDQNPIGASVRVPPPLFPLVFATF